MSHGRFTSLAVATTAGIIGGIYVFKPELENLEKEKEKENQVAHHIPPKSSNTVDNPAEKPGVAAKLNEPVANTKLKGKDLGV